MKRRFLLLFLLLLLPAVALGQDYHPQQSGFSWTYTNGETQTLSGPREFQGQQVMVLTHWLFGDAVSEDYLVYSPAGVMHVGTAAGGTILNYNPPLKAFDAGPFQAGSKWQSSSTISGLQLTMSAEVLGTVGVETPAGRFNAFQIRQVTVTSTGGQTVLDAYFVPSVGVVRYVLQDGTVINLLEKNF